MKKLHMQVVAQDGPEGPVYHQQADVVRRQIPVNKPDQKSRDHGFEDIDEKGHNPRRKAQDPDGVGGSDVAGPVLGEVHPPDTPHDAPAQAEAAGVADQK